jgi:pimeloyl-ACP methyl ester carboxylesterase
MNEHEGSKDVQPQPELERTGWQGCLLGIGIIVGTLSLFLCLVVGLIWAGSNRARAELKAKYPPPGQMVDVGGYQLHVNCQGASEPGVPTVVLEAGAGEFSLTWDQVQRQVAEFARVCTYDRAGLGWSERGPNPRIAPYVVDEFDTLLKATGVEPPYVLVGHSMGALYTRFYFYQYPDRVAGMVLVDGGHEETYRRLPEALVRADAQTKQILRIPQVLSAVGLFARDPAGISSDFLPPKAPGTEETYNAIVAMSPWYFSTLIEEHAAAEESYTVVRNLPDRSLGKLPLVVISAGASQVPDLLNLTAEEQAALTTVQAELQADLADLSSNSRQVLAEDAGHYVHIEQPDLVIEAIREVMDAAQH